MKKEIQKVQAVMQETLLPVVRIQIDTEKHPSFLDSKCGGEFYLPADAEVPTADDGREMEFLAQINLSQAPVLAGFPSQGMLQFFVDTNEEAMEDMESAETMDGGRFRVLYYPEIEEDASAHPEQELEDILCMTEHIQGGMIFEKAEETATLSIGEFHFITDLGQEAVLDKITQELLEDAGYDFSGCPDTDSFCNDFGNWGFKMGGHPAIRQGDFRLDEEGFEEYSVLLFQYDLTREDELEADTFTFFIKPEDLAACRFDDILLCWHNCY